MKRYRLLKDAIQANPSGMMIIKAGTVAEWTYPYYKCPGWIFSKEAVEDHPEWWEPIKEVTYTELDMISFVNWCYADNRYKLMHNDGAEAIRKWIEYHKPGVTKKLYFNIGDWAWHNYSERAFLVVKSGDVNEALTYYYEQPYVNASVNFTRHATQDEVEVSLTIEAKRRGYKKGNIISWPGERNQEIMADAKFTYERFGLFYGMNFIWRPEDNLWAEIVK